MKVFVFDSQNKNRMLGTIRNVPMPSDFKHGRVFRMAVYGQPQFRVKQYTTIQQIHDEYYRVLDFRVEELHFNGGWGTLRVLTTDEPLPWLVRIREFAIPEDADLESFRRFLV